MSTAHNHQIRTATADELAGRPGTNGLCISTRWCVAPVRYFTSYSFATGRAGRIGHRENAVCTFHAQQFAARHGVPMPEGSTQ